MDVSKSSIMCFKGLRTFFQGFIKINVKIHIFVTQVRIISKDIPRQNICIRHWYALHKLYHCIVRYYYGVHVVIVAIYTAASRNDMYLRHAVGYGYFMDFDAANQFSRTRVSLASKTRARLSFSITLFFSFFFFYTSYLKTRFQTAALFSSN